MGMSPRVGSNGCMIAFMGFRREMVGRAADLVRRSRDVALQCWLGMPPRVLRRFSGGKTVVDGQELDAHVQALLFAMRVARIRDPDGVEAARRAMEENLRAIAPRRAAMREMRDLTLTTPAASLRARLYVPTTAPSTPPLLVFFHGGGFVVGSIASHEPAVRELASLARVAALSVEYRLAPEHKAPTAALDACDAYRWAREHARELGCDDRRVGVGGDSAGGNVSAVLCHLCRERGLQQPDLQLLIYPGTDFTCSMRSHEVFGSGFVLEADRIEWYMRHYVSNMARRREPTVSPLFWPRFDDLAPAVVVTAGFDPLRDEGAAYAERLREAGVAVVYRCERSLIHGFFNMSGVIPAARDANQRIAAEVRGVLAG